MRVISFLLSAIFTGGLVYLLDNPIPLNGSKTPRLGFFLSPQHGFWKNAETGNHFSDALNLAGLTDKAEVYFDERLVPHIYSTNTTDAYFIQGYLHARFRLWQMEFQVMAAGGRLSEIMGDSSGGTHFLGIDRFFRRLGMVAAAEKAAEAISEDPEVSAACEAYTAGANAWIENLTPADYPLEYKLLNYAPEPWSLLKTCLLLKYMSFDLAGYEEDMEKTYMRQILSSMQYEMLFPLTQDSLQPIVPLEYGYPKVQNFSIPPAGSDSNYLSFMKEQTTPGTALKPNKRNGSNNWAVAGNKTLSGRPILCNDPHLGLNLPALWYEMQVHTPDYNAYGVGFPGSPCVIIGFNQHCAWGFTNAERDVRDYYEITFKDASRNEYLYNGKWLPTTWRIEKIKCNGKPDFIDSIAYTHFGPVMYEPTFPDKTSTGKYLACRWKAHDKSNELRTFYKLNYAKNFEDYTNAISTYTCPSQNMLFATRTGDIAICQQGVFPAKWRRQGDFIMPGQDSTYNWQYSIPDTMNIIMHNPSRGFVSSCNQYPYLPQAYPFYLNGTYSYYRGQLTNRLLGSDNTFTVEKMQKLQTNDYNLMAETAMPLLLKYMQNVSLNEREQKLFEVIKKWDYVNDSSSVGATIFYVWRNELMKLVYRDELPDSPYLLPLPEETTLFKGLKDSVYIFADNIHTQQRENSYDIVRQAFTNTSNFLEPYIKKNNLTWGHFKDGGVYHLLKLPALSKLHINSGGGNDIINAFHDTHGPSWRMVIELTDDINAYGIYPGGQSGNPGSKYYTNFIDDWAQYKYYKLELMDADAARLHSKHTGQIIFTKLN
jgi:penicillin amidase